MAELGKLSGAADPPPIPQEVENLLERFNQYFDVVLARDEKDREEAYRLRYQVYCVEHPFENANEHPDGLERDGFDEHSDHSLLIHRASGEVIGTVRLVLPIDGKLGSSFAVQQVCDHPDIRTSRLFPLHAAAEVSRFSISKRFRRRVTDTLFEGAPEPAARPRPYNRTPLMTLGLIQSLVHMSCRRGILYWCAAMEPTLHRLLAAMAIHFEPIGPLIRYHGLRQPCYCDVDHILKNVRLERPDYWEVLTLAGALWSTMS